MEISKPDKYIRYESCCKEDEFLNEHYEKLNNASIYQKEEYFDELAKEVSWSKPYSKVLDSSNPPQYRWYPDGELNICFNALDRQVLRGNGEGIAFIYDSVYLGLTQQYTYNEVLNKVGRIATILKHKFDVQKGDRVLIYMPMIPMSCFVMLACARIGAIHSVVFGGFAAKEITNRIEDCKPKLVITASCGIEPGKVIHYRPIIDDAISHVKNMDNPIKTLKRIIYQRKEKFVDTNIDKEVYFDLDEMLEEEHHVSPCTPVESNHPLYILYTSGTTGAPKGVVRDTGGTTVMLNWVMKNVFNLYQNDVYLAASDIGWVVGHSFVVYGPLIRGATSIIFEGKPVVPDPGVFWRMVEQYKIKQIYAAPTAIRIIKKEDYEGNYFKKYDVSSLQAFHLVGERCDPDTITWLHRNLPNLIINDNWFQTETGWPMCSNFLNLKDFKTVYPTLPGSVTKPVPGFDVQIFDDHNEKIHLPNTLGRVVVKLPMPPSFMLTLWGNEEAFIQKYLSDTPGYYTTGDAGMIDEHGYVHIMTRVDDVINTAGHRLSTGRLEEVINDHEQVVESAVVGYNDEIKGECPFAFVILQGNSDLLSTEAKFKLAIEINTKVRNDVGPIATLTGVIIVNRLPKTRSGKILRGTIRKLLNRQEFKIPATIDDTTILDSIKIQIEEWLTTNKR